MAKYRRVTPPFEYLNRILLEVTEMLDFTPDAFLDANCASDACYICGKPIKDKAGKSVHVGEGGAVLLKPGERSSEDGFDEDGEGGMGFFPIGSGCARKPEFREYAHK